MRALAQGVGSRRPLLLYPRGVPPARGCAVARLRLRWRLVFAAVAGGVVSGGMSLVSLWLGSSLLVAWGNCYHRRCFAACRRRVGGLWLQNPRVVAWKGQRRVLFMWLCWLCSACLRVFVVVVWLVFVGGLGGIATIGAALRRVVGVSGVYGRKTPRVVAREGQGRVPVEGSMVAKPPSACSKCRRPRWYAGDMGCLGCFSG